MIEIGVRLSLQNRRQYVQGLDESSRATDRLGTAAERTGRKASLASRGLDGMRSAAGHVGSGLGALAGGALHVAGRGLGVLATGVSALGAAAVVTGIKSYSGMQQAGIGFTTMLGSGKAAQSFLKDLQAFAATTPFEFPELQTAASSLISAGFAAKDVIPIMKSVGNATSGMGTGAEGVQRATVALQQMSAAGKITGEDLNQLRDAGIPVFDLLAAATGKSKEAVAGLAQKGKLGKKEMLQLFDALKTGKGLERFEGLMDKQSRTLQGRFSTLKDTVSQGLGRAFAPLGDLLTRKLADAQPKIDQVFGRLGKIGNAAQGGHSSATSGGRLADTAATAGLKPETALKVERAYARLRVEVPKAVGKIRQAVIGAGPAMHRVLAGIGPAARDAFGALRQQAPLVTRAVHAAGSVFAFLGRHMDVIVKVGIPLLIAGLIAMRAKQAAATATAWLDIPVRILEAVTLMASASANRALAFQLSILTGRQQASRLAMLRSLVVMVASKAATIAMTLYTRAYVIGMKAAALATKLFSLALATVGPVGLVLIIAAIVVGVIALYKNSETARKVMQGAFRLIGGAILQVGEVLLKAMLLPLRTVLRLVGSFPNPFRSAARNASKSIDGVFTSLDGLQKKLADVGKPHVIPLSVQVQTSQVAARKAALAGGATPVAAAQAAGVAGKLAGAKAAGGSVLRTRPYLIGERGPEVFVPQVSGRVVTQQQAASQARLSLPPYAGGAAPPVVGGDGGSASLMSRGGDTHHWNITVNEARDGPDAYTEVSRRVEDVLARR